MGNISIYSEFDTEYTLISDLFVDHYMASANGEFVKIYIYLLRKQQSGTGVPDLSSVADALLCTENDVLRALLYWEKKGLLSLSLTDGEVTSVTMRMPSGPQRLFSDGSGKNAFSGADERSAAGGFSGTLGERAGYNKFIPESIGLSNERRRALMSSDEEAKQIVFISQKYIGKPLTGTDLNRILYFYDELHFSVDLIEYLIEYCVSRNKRSIHYITKVGLGWYQDGITTVQEAKERADTWNKDYYTILRALGITGVNPVKRQTDFMDRWLKDYGFSLEMICEACGRAVAKTGQPSFEYTEGILSSWKANHAASLEEVRLLDEAHQQKSSSPEKKASTEGRTQEGKKSFSNRFNNFHQREYDFHQLEKELLQKQLSEKKQNTDQ